MNHFSFTRFKAIIQKEFIQMRRDRLTFAMLIGIPLLQLVLFGYAINSNPKHLPTAVIAADHSPITREITTALQNTDYFTITHPNTTEHLAKTLLAEGNIVMALTIPAHFSRDLHRGQHPTIAMTVDASDPMTVGNAISAANAIQSQLPGLGQSPPAFSFTIQKKYNPEQMSEYNIVPGLMGVVLTMTMVMITALAITREAERGTMEYLLSTPVRPLEVMLGKVIPYVLLGYLQMLLILGAALFLFKVPCYGNIFLLLLCAFPFICANLAVGLTFSTIAKNQLQALQMAFFFFLPSILLSGFMFPFYGMPRWAQIIGTALPLTHFIRIVRGILLKGNGFTAIMPQGYPILIFLGFALAVGLLRYRQTLD